jgi:hypothetical protein
MSKQLNQLKKKNTKSKKNGAEIYGAARERILGRGAGLKSIGGVRDT